MAITLRRRLAAACIAAAVAAVPAACGGTDDDATPAAGDAGDDHAHAHGESEPQFAAADASSTIDLELRDFAFVGAPPSTKGPNVLFRTRVTTGEHELVVKDASGSLVAAIDPYAPDDGPKDLAAVLQPGTYSLVCEVSEGARTHDELGMRSQLVVE